MAQLIDFDAINAAGLAALPGLLQEWLPGGRFEGHEYTCGDLAGGAGRSVRINVRTGKGGDFSSGDKMAGDPVGLYAIIFNVSRIDAARAIAHRLGLDAHLPADYRPQQHARPALPARPDDGEAEAEKMAKVADIIAVLQPVAGTPAETYLRSRGLRGAPRGTIAWWPDQDVYVDEKLRRRAKPGYGALCCIARDDAGTVRAVQRIMLKPDGTKDTGYSIVKRSNGLVRGAGWFLQGKETGVGPLLLTEGPEDGLALRQCTGLDVMVGFGVNSLASLPVPDGRAAIFVRDNDAPGSDADKAVVKVIERLLDRGIPLLCTRPPEGVKDANALLQAVGPQAVVDMCNAAQVVADHRYVAPAPEDAPPPPPAPDLDAPGLMDMPPPEFQECAELPPTDTGNAQRIVKRWGGILMYSPGLGWHIYGRGCWDGGMADMRVLKMAQLTAQDIAQEAAYMPPHEAKERLKWGSKSQMGGHINYAIGLARPYVARQPIELDADPWAFNCRNGVVDLRTGVLRAHAASDYITKQAPVDYAPDAKCPMWELTLRQIFQPHPDLIPFVQRAVGYSLTGDISEQCMMIAHGYGSNGKSTFLETLQAIIGPYWAKTQAETFAAKDRENPGAPNPSVAALRGARFVTASETNEGLRLNEGLVKEVTGDAFITVRKLHQEPFTFRPAFKLWLGTNHKPEIRGTDHGIWRRIRLIPFDAVFYDSADADAPTNGPFKDKMLPAKLRAELPGILAWAVRGALQWRRDGLEPPASVQRATAEYRSEMDTLGTCLDEIADQRAGTSVLFKDFYDAYERWCTEAGHFKLSRNKLAKKLRERGIKVERSGNGGHMHASGLALRAAWQAQQGNPRYAQDGLEYR